MAEEMKLGEEERVFLFEGVRNLGQRYAFFRAYVPEEIGQNIRLEEVDNPLFIEFIERVEKEALETVKRAQQTTSASVADEALATIMKVEGGAFSPGRQAHCFSKFERAVELSHHQLSGERL